MELITRLWKNFKVQPEIWFFYGFLLTFTLTIRKVLWFFPLRGEFNEYTGVYLYLSDIFLGLTILAWIYTILYNKYSISSMFRNNTLQEECSTPASHRRTVSVSRGGRGTMVYILLPLALVFWSFISLIWTENKIVAIFRSIKVLEFYLLYIFVLVRFFYWNVPRGTILKKIFGLIMIIGLSQSIIGIIQFILQHSIGLFWLKESLISPNISGVAKIIFSGETFIRAYGLFPHPNILGGFLLFSTFVSLLYYKMFHTRRNVPRLPRFLEMFHVEHFQNLWGGTLFKVLLGIQLLALILTFSKSAILGLFLGLIYMAYVSRGTLANFIIMKKRLILATSLIIVFAFIIAKPDLHSFFIKSLNDRQVYINVSPARIAMQSIAGGRGTIKDLEILVLGIGNGQFVLSMENMPVIKENWMLEPVHNVFLLVWSELGIVGLLILFLFIFYILRMFPPVNSKIVPHGTILEHGASVGHSTRQAWNNSDIAKTFSAIFIGLLFIMFFDHYLWDIQQGSFLLWMTMGFLVGIRGYKDNIDKI